MAVNKRDYYEVLGVTRSSSEQDLKSAYRRLAHQYHPDKNRNDPQAEEKFKEAAEAYAVLSDPEQRRRYDRFGHAGVSKIFLAIYSVLAMYLAPARVRVAGDRQRIGALICVTISRLLWNRPPLA